MKLGVTFSAASIMLVTNLYAGSMGSMMGPDFSGFYAGLGAGQTTLFNKDDFAITRPGLGTVRTGSNKDTDSAVIFSGQLGYGRMYHQTTYLGVKGSVFYTPLEDTDQYTYSSGGSTFLINGVDSFTRSVKPIYNIDAVLGYELFPSVLPFIEGGVSFANVKHNFSAAGTVTDVNGVVSLYSGAQTLNDYKTGYNVGLGANYLVHPNWFLSSELVYHYLGKKNLTLTNIALPIANSATHFRSEKNQAVSFLLGASYLFAG